MGAVIEDAFLNTSDWVGNNLNDPYLAKFRESWEKGKTSGDWGSFMNKTGFKGDFLNAMLNTGQYGAALFVLNSISPIPFAAPAIAIMANYGLTVHKNLKEYEKKMAEESKDMSKSNWYRRKASMKATAAGVGATVVGTPLHLGLSGLNKAGEWLLGNTPLKEIEKWDDGSKAGNIGKVAGAITGGFRKFADWFLAPPQSQALKNAQAPSGKPAT